MLRGCEYWVLPSGTRNIKQGNWSCVDESIGGVGMLETSEKRLTVDVMLRVTGVEGDTNDSCWEKSVCFLFYAQEVFGKLASKLALDAHSSMYPCSLIAFSSAYGKLLSSSGRFISLARLVPKGSPMIRWYARTDTGISINTVNDLIFWS
jgi:hypothetical protein